MLAALASAQELPQRRASQSFEHGLGELLPADMRVRSLTAAPIDELLFDQRDDGALWTRGSAYKARFDGAGATIVPFFGSDAPRNYPLALNVAEVTFADAPLDRMSDAVATRDGSTVSIDHGSFVEEYRLTCDALEQRFVFPSLNGAGDLVLRMDCATELAASDLGATLRFENELGRIDYGEAFAIDAKGARIALDSVLVDGAIELRVPASFVERAALPLVIDPLVTFYTVAGSAHQEIYPDVAYDAGSDRWCIAWADVWSATDHDVFVRLATGSYQLLSTLTIDFSTETWTTPKIANLNGFDVFLVAAAVVPFWSPYWSIHGRMVFPGNTTTGAPFQISPADATDRNWPDVGGDPYPAQVSSFCVVWQRVIDANNVDIEAQLVAADNTLYGGVKYLENGSDLDEHPYISNSTGVDVFDGTSAWTVTWQSRATSYDHDIYGAQIDFTGSIIHPKFPIETSGWDETEAMAATILDSTGFGAPRTYMVVYERDFGTDHDVIAAIMQGPTVLTSVNLIGGVDPAIWYYDQRFPAIDSDGEQFLVGFVERTTPSAYDANIWMCDYFWSNGALVPCELRANLAGSVQMETDVAVHSMASSGGPRQRFLATWDFEAINTSLDVIGGLWDACTSGYVESFCAGDGSGTTCPCNNNGTSGRGCANSVNSSGALLTWSGAARTCRS